MAFCRISALLRCDKLSMNLWSRMVRGAHQSAALGDLGVVAFPGTRVLMKAAILYNIQLGPITRKSTFLNSSP
eukprot:19073-Pleurochrysis_carterae.AAC.1